SFGCALVATSKSFGRIPRSRSRTHPPTRYARKPLRRRRRTTFTASGSSRLSGISGGGLGSTGGAASEVSGTVSWGIKGPPSARRPPHHPPPEAMHVQVKDGLDAVRTGVDQRSVAVRHALARQGHGHFVQVAD